MPDRDRNTESFEDVFTQGTNLLHSGRASQAIPYLEKAHTLDPEHTDAALNLGGAYILTKKFKQAIALLEPVSKRDPENAMVWTNLGAAYLGNPVLANDREQQSAIEAFKQALRINPVAPSVAYNIGLIYRDRQEFEQAIYWFKQAVKANPQDKDARLMFKKLSEQSSQG